MSLEAFDPQEVQRHPLRSLPESLRFRTPERKKPLIPDGLLALAVDVLVGSTGGSGSMLASRTELAQVPFRDVPRRTPLESPLH